MSNNFVLQLVAVAISAGVSASAYADDLSQFAKGPAALTGVQPAQRRFGAGAGFSVIEAQKEIGLRKEFKLHPTGSLTQNGLSRPDSNWRDGLVALPLAFPSEATLLGSIVAQQALMPPQVMRGNQEGFSAIKASAALSAEQDSVLQGLR